MLDPEKEPNRDAAENNAVSCETENCGNSAKAATRRLRVRTSLKKKKKRRIVCIVLCSVFALILLLLAAVWGVFKHYYDMIDYNDLNKDWESAEIVDDTDVGEDIDSIDSSLIASDEEKDKFLDQIDNVGSGNFEIEVKKLGGSLGTVERDYVCDYISYNDDVINILLIGLDSRMNVNVGLSDVMMVVSICPSEKKIVLTSFLRDVYVMIPGYGANRLNVAYMVGGPSLLIETIEKNYGLRIDRYATSNFFAFVEVADYIGKVNIYLNEAELSVLNDHIRWTNNVIYKNNTNEQNKYKDRIENKGPGYYELNGVQALAYARIRKLDSDFGRTNRQRVVMSALFDEVKKMSPMEWNGVLEKILPMITTNLSESDILKIMLNIGAYIKYDMELISMPPIDNYRYMVIDGRAVIGVDQDFIRGYLKEHIYSGK